MIRITFVTILISVIFSSTFVHAEKIKVKNIDELKAAIENKLVTEIILDPGVYEGNFVIRRGGLKISTLIPNSVILSPADHSKPVFYFNGPFLGRHKKLLLENLTFHGHSKAELAIKIDSYRNVTLSSIESKNFDVNVHLRLVENATIKNCKFNAKEFNIFGDSSTGNIKISDCVFSSTNTNGNSLKNAGLIVNQGSFIDAKYSIIKCIFLDLREAVRVEKISKSSTIDLIENDFDNVVVPLNFWTPVENTESLLSQYLSLIDHIFYYFNDFERDVLTNQIISENTTKDYISNISEYLMLAIGTPDYIKRTTMLRRYLSDIMRDPDSLIENLDNIIFAIKCIALPPFIKIEDAFDVADMDYRRDLFFEQLVQDPGLEEVIVSAAIAVEGKKPDIFQIIKPNLKIDGIATIDLVGRMPNTRVEAFRSNFQLYANYRDLLSYANTYANNLHDFTVFSNEISIDAVRKTDALLSAIVNIRSLGDKAFRITHFDLPLWVIMLQLVAELNYADKDKDKLHEIGLNFASYGIIRYRAIVGDSTIRAFDGLKERFKKDFGRFSKRKYNQFVTAMETSPPWWKDTGIALIQETELK